MNKKETNKEALITKLKSYVELSHDDPEQAHSFADDALLEYIGDELISAYFHSIIKWYA